MRDLNWVELTEGEQTRTYHFPDASITVERVIRFAVSSTTHRLETSDGKKWIIPNGFVAIEVEATRWSA